jgi:hypothetical protein
MPIAAGVVTLITIACIVHIYQTGRPRWWMMVVLIAPILGAVAYFMFEVFPNSRQGVRTAKTINRTIDDISKGMDPSRDLRKLAANAEECGSVDNRIKLANECMSCGLGAEAVNLVRSCLTGPFANDPAILFDLARAQLCAKQFDEATATLSGLQSQHAGYRPAEITLLRAQVLRDQGKADEALSAYAEAAERAVGEQARLEYAQMLVERGQSERARLILERIAANAQRNNDAYRELNREWVRKAQALLSDINRPS